MAKDNLNRTEKNTQSETTAALKLMTLGILINKNQNPPFGLHLIIFSITVSYEGNLTSQRSYLEALLLSRFWSER